MGKGHDTKKKNNILPDSKKHTKKKGMERGERGISAILDSFREELASNKQSNNMIPPPSPRLYSTLVSNPLSSNELLLFGGEYYDGSTCHFYANFIKYCIKERQWISLPYGPSPRSSHQCVATSQGQVYIFGGECASSKESQYYHYKDFWCFDIKTLQWKELQPGPPPRSGHRMVLWKHYLVLYGGFFDTTNELKYYDDIWIYDLKSDGKWIKTTASINNIHNPSSRSGFVFLPLEDGIFMYGGYVKSMNSKGIAKGNILNDAFILKINPIDAQYYWESIRIPGLTNTCPRSGVSGIVYKNRVYLFGGLFDPQELEEDESTSHDSECFQDLRLVQPYDKKCHIITIASNNDNNPDNLHINTLSVSYDTTPQYIIKQSTIHPRCHATIAVQSNHMFIYGGKYEKQDREYTLDDLYQLDLDKMDGFLCLQQSTVPDHVWIESDDSDSTSDHYSDSSNDSSDMEMDQNVTKDGESLKEFFNRTQQFWIDKVTSINNHTSNSKTIRTDAFMMAKEHYESTIK